MWRSVGLLVVMKKLHIFHQNIASQQIFAPSLYYFLWRKYLISKIKYIGWEGYSRKFQSSFPFCSSIFIFLILPHIISYNLWKWYKHKCNAKNIICMLRKSYSKFTKINFKISFKFCRTISRLETQALKLCHKFWFFNIFFIKIKIYAE